MAVFGNFKGTTKSDFQIGKNGNKISTGSQPTTDISNGDLFIDSSSSELQIYSNAWVGIGDTLTSLNVDNGTLIVDSANDTVSVGSAASNEKLFVNGNLRLGTNPSLQHSGAYLDLRHSNGSTTQVRLRDNGSSTDPIFKIYNAGNSAEVFKVQGNEVSLADNVKAKFGDSGDLEIYHDGNNSYIDDAGTGSLRIRSGTTTISNAAGSKTSVVFNSGGSQDLYHNNSKKFETTNSGIAVTGTVDVNGEYDLPTSDGTSGQAMVTDGNGSVTFETIGETVTDYGLITESANVTVNDYGAITDEAREPTSHDSYTVSEANNIAIKSTGDMIFISDETGGAVMAFYDGTSWRRITDRAVIST